MKDDDEGRDRLATLLFIASVGVGTAMGFAVAELLELRRSLTILLTAVGSGVTGGILFTLARLLR